MLSRSHVALGLALLVSSCLGFVQDAHAVLPTGFTDEQMFTTGLSQPTGFTFLADGRALIVEQKTGAIKLVRFTPLAGATIFTVPDIQPAGNEQGLLGIAVDPGWPARPYIYVYFDRTPGAVIYIRRYMASGDLTDPTSLTITLGSPYNIITDIPDQADNHNGGTLRFGPDGMLYASLGDDALVMCDAQVLAQFKGKILRMNVAALPDTGAGPAPKALITPADNPFVSDPSPNGKLVYALGFRNPFRFTIDKPTGELFIGDVGLNTWEEYDRGNSGDNMGWPRREGAHAGPQPGCPGSNGEDPIAEYPQAAGSYSIIGGPRYRPVAGPAGVNNFPVEYYGDVFFTDYYQGFMRRYKETSPGVWTRAAMVPGQPDSLNWANGLANFSDIQIGPDGALWYVKQFGPAKLARIKGIPSSSVGAHGEGLPPALALAVTPNPAHPSGTMTIDYALPSTSAVTIAVYDVRGARVASVFEGTQEAGTYQASWNGLDSRGSKAAAGVYFVRLETAAGESVSRKLALVR